MAKKLLQYYTFDAATQTITIEGIYGLDRFLMITNVTDNIILYVFSNPDFGFSSYSIDTEAETTTVVVDYDTTSMSNGDELQIFIEQEGQEFIPAEPYVDAVSKFRVTNPQNLIDTDFEYGLQSTKWETLELVKNIPTFYSRNGDESLDLVSITRTSGSEIISVQTDQAHGLAVGNPIIVQGTDSISANGAFVITKVVDTTNFQYKSKSSQTTTGSILDTYTQVFVGSVYQGTEFQLSDINSITTNGASPASTLTVTTETPTGFSTGTSFFLSNSVGSKQITFDATAVNPSNTGWKVETHNAPEETDDQDTSGWSRVHWQPYKWTPKKAKFYVGGTDPDATITVQNTNEMTFTDGGHGFSTGDCVMHYNASGNTVPGGLSERSYYITAVDANTIKLSTTYANYQAGTFVTISSAGAAGLYARSCFAEAIEPISLSSNTFTFRQNVPYTDTPYIAAYTTVSNFQASAGYNAAQLLSNYDDFGSGHVCYALSSGSTTTQFSNTDGGTVRAFTSTTLNGVLVPMKPWAGQHEGFSVYLPDAGFADGDYVTIEHESTYPTGLAVNKVYELEVVGSDYPNRFRIRNAGATGNNAIVEFTTWGNQGTGNAFQFKEADWRTMDEVTTEAGFNYSVFDAHWLTPDDAIYFKPDGVDATIASNQLTFATPHGITNGDTYAYFMGYGNAVINTLSDSRWYYIKVIDNYTIEFHLNADLTSSKRAITAFGTNGGRTRSSLIRCYTTAGAGGASDTKEEFYFVEPLAGATTGGSQAYFPIYTTFGGFNVGSNSSYLVSDYSSYLVYPKKVTNSGQTVVFSSTVNGSVKNVSNTTATGAVIKVSLNPARWTMLSRNASKWTVGDYIYHVSSGTAGGLSSGAFYMIDKIVGNRIGFRALASSTSLVFTRPSNYTTSSYYSYWFPRSSYNSEGDYINATNHGLNDGDLVAYDAGSGNVPLKGLTDGTTYYVFNSENDKFQLATTINGFSEDAVEFNQSNTYISSNVNIYPGPTTSTVHNFNTGDRVQYLSDTPVPGLQNGQFYFVKDQASTYIRLYQTREGAINSVSTDLIYIGYPRTGSGTFRKTTAVDILTAGTGNQTLNASTVGSSDGVYTIDSIVDNTTFTMAANTQISNRSVNFSGLPNVWVEQDAIYLPDHFFVNGQEVTYSHDAALTSMGGLTNGSNYFIIKVDRNWIRLASSAADVLTNSYITITSKSGGTHTLTASAISGEVIGEGTVSVDTGNNKVTGVGTNFTSFFNTGDSITLYQDPSTTSLAVTGVNTSTAVYTTAAHGLTTGDMVVMDAVDPPLGTVNGYIYYVSVLTSTTFTIHTSEADAIAGTNAVNASDAGTTVAFKIYNDLGNVHTGIIKAVTGPGTLELVGNATVSLSDANYAIGTSLLMRADGFALHRPYDGGVDLIPSKNPDSSMIRQTRRYFRYQSGKSIQVSFAVNFSPSTQIEGYTYDSVTQLGTITTRYPHRLDDTLSVVISGATTTSPTNYWNGVKAIDSIVDDYTFKVTQGGAPTVDAASGPGGLPEFYVQSWSNSALRCGLFDDQNGMFFEYDGSTLYACRRSSTLQLTGTSSVTFRSGQIVGTGTKYSKQVVVGDKIVIKGQTHVITNIASDTLMYIMPSYRGVSNSNVIITKTEITRVAQNNWNLDPCDGTGPTGFYLRPHRIQMAYIDYSWYGAGKVRFGFKDQRGRVVYIHEFVHNNHKNEAYLRSGNLPARYEIENVGVPTYVPALAHWGTSVIMDGKFDPDSAYVFTAGSNNIQLTGSSNVTVSARAETQSDYYYFFNNRWYNLGRALLIETPSFLYNSVPVSKLITGASVDSSTYTRNPYSYFGLPNQPYQVSLRTRYGNANASSTEDVRNLMLINRSPTGTAGTVSNYTVTVATTGAPVVYDVPLISIRLAPSVDTNTPGFLGEREIINRMQLILNSVGILSTHNAEVTLRLNGLTTNTAWERVQNPSLSQLVYHTNQDTISGGIDIFEFRAQGGVGTTGRSALVTDQSLIGTTTLGNSILGGDNVFPDGPDVLTVVAKLSEDPSTVSNTNPFNVTARISWSESQA